MSNLISKTFGLFKDTAVSFGKDYFSNVESLRNDAEMIKNTLVTETKTATSAFKKIKSNVNVKSITNWFSDRTAETESYDMDDDFDSGMNLDEDGEPQVSRKHSVDEMAHKEQLNTMYNIASKQTEAGIANTAEIVSTIDNRFTEMATSINNLNSTMINMSKNLDRFINMYAGINTSKKTEYKDSGDITNYDGSLSLEKIMNLSTTNVKSNPYLEMAKIFVGELKNGSPAEALSFGAHMLVDNKKIKAFGDKTIDEIGKSFNTAVGSITQNAIAELIASKPFAKLFGDINSTESDRDYSKYINNQYNNKRAAFDGMTRFSIISVIPEYLKLITAGVTGEKYNIGNNGLLTKSAAPTKRFDKVTREAYSNSGLSYDSRSEIAEDVKAVDITIDSGDVDTAGKALTMVYVMYLHNKGIRTIRASQISVDDVAVIDRAVKTLTNASGKSASFWTPICMSIMQRLSTHKIECTNFVEVVNKQLNSMVDKATEFATNSPYSYQASKITSTMADEQFKNDYRADNPDKVVDNKTPVKVQASHTPTTQFTTNDYIEGIFNVLNRGINVHTTGTKPFGRFKLKSSSTVTDIERVKPKKHEKPDDGVKDISNGDGKSYLSNMIDNLVPEGLKIPMQFFGKTVGIIPTNDTNLDGTKRETIGSKIKTLAEPITSTATQIGRNIIGTKETDIDGKTHRVGGIVQAVGGKIHNEMNNVGDDIKASLDRGIVKQEYRQLQRDVAKMDKTDEASAVDQSKAQQVFSLMQAAVSSGKTSDDIGDITKIINSIKNGELKSRLQSSVLGMLKRNDEKASGDDGKKSIVGKVLVGIGIVAGKILSPIKKVFGVILRGLKSFGGKIFKLIKMGLSSGLRDLTTGVSAMAQSLFGTKAKYDSDGNEIESGSNGILGKILVTPLKAIAKHAKTLLSTVTKYTVGFYKGIGKLATGAFEKIGGVFNSIKDKFNSNKEETVSDNDGEETPKEEKKPKSEFIQGFTSVFKEINEKKEKARLKSLKPETVSDVKTTDMLDMLGGKTESIFSSILKVTEDILSKVVDEEETTTESGTASSGSGELDGQTSMFDDTPTNNTTSSTGSTATTSAGASLEGGDTAVGATGGKKKGFGFDLGKMLGGISAALLGIGKIILTVVTSMEGFKALTNIVEDMFTEGLKPLNKAFNEIRKALEPVIKVTTKIITTVAESITQIVESLLDTIQPLIETLTPIIETIMTILQPILDTITGLVEVIMAPLAGVLINVVVPIIRHIGNCLQITLGVVQTGMGLILTGIGGLLTGIGGIAKFLTGNDKLLETGKTVLDMGTSMVKSGTDSVKTGISKEVQLVKDTLSGNPSGKKKEEETETKKVPTVKASESVTSGGSVMDGTVSTPDMSQTGSGDSSLNQHSFVTQLNMGNRGCGPVAVADVCARRTGRRVNAGDLAKQMNSSGNYNPDRGTSVSAIVNTSRALGMNATVGGVTQRSLKTASPNNPITLLGSGISYGTKNGNNHYVNVVGTDRHGGTYTMNPLSGRVERHTTNDIVSGARLGIYGSGDSDGEDKYSFGEATTTAMKALKDTAGKLISMFTGDNSNDLQETMDAEKDKEAAYQLTHSLDESSKNKLEIAAKELFTKENPRRDGETDEEYEKRYQNNHNKYLTRAGNADDSFTSQITGGMDKFSSFIDKNTGDKLDSFVTDMVDAGKSVGDNGQNSSNSSSYPSGDGRYISENGVFLGGTEFESYVRETDMTLEDASNPSQRSMSPLLAFMAKMFGEKAYVLSDGGMFGNRTDPDKNGKGRKSTSHQGIDINADNDSDGKHKVVATTDGTVTQVNINSASTGNSVSWKDPAGFRHRVMHMANKPSVANGDKLIGGSTTLGYVGNTGQSFGDHLHYDIAKLSGTATAEDTTYKGEIFVNPLTYWKYKSPSLPGSSEQAGAITMTPAMEDGNAWGAYDHKPGIIKFLDQAKKAGLNAAQTAAVAMTGIWEDSGAKLDGTKDLTAITHDENGQAAVGIMNWIPINPVNGHDAHFGTTVEEQLEYMKKEYFDENATHTRSIALDPKRSGYNWGDAYTKVTGRNNFQIPIGERYGPRMASAPLEGAAQFTGTAVVPGGFVSEDGMAQRVGTAAGAYNWLLKNGWGNGDISSAFNVSKSDYDLPPLPVDNTQYDNTTQPIVVNKYDIKRNDEYERERLRLILTNTYNVKAERVEELLEQILDKLNDKKDKTSTKYSKSNNQTPDLFGDNDIPSKISRLYV